MEKKLYRSNDRKIFGVCGGLAEYFGINPLIVRILWIIFAVNTNGLGVVIYSEQWHREFYPHQADSL